MQITAKPINTLNCSSHEVCKEGLELRVNEGSACMKTVTNILLIISYLCSFSLQMLTNARRKNIPVQPTQNVSTLFLHILVHAFLDIKDNQSFAKVGNV